MIKQHTKPIDVVFPDAEKSGYVDYLERLLPLGAPSASRVFPHTTRFVWKRIDIHWMPEACVSHPTYRGFYTVREFIDRDPMPGNGVRIRTSRVHLTHLC